MWLLNPYRFGDPDAAAYIAAVEAADGQVLEAAVASAITAFVVGCKTDGTWNALKASCIMAGARTLAGALVPLRGTAPTNFNFVAGDYNRKTGLKGDGNVKYLGNAGNASAQQQNSVHLSFYVSAFHSTTAYIIGTGIFGPGATQIGQGGAIIFARNRSATDNYLTGRATGFIGTQRDNSASYTIRHGLTNTAFNVNSQSNIGLPNYSVYGSDTNTGARSADRLSFYSIGEAIDLALLDARVTTLMNALAAAIP
jgi:hypothetical protein